LRRLVEKPEPGEEPSNVANISRYIMTPKITDYVRDLKPDLKSGEYYVTDAVSAAAKHLKIVIHRATGQWLDAGSVSGWLQANQAVATSQPELTKLARK
jgi:UTP--glucose-1-phosphate uridylyltransferase